MDNILWMKFTFKGEERRPCLCEFTPDELCMNSAPNSDGTFERIGPGEDTLTETIFAPQ